ncbi:MAG: ccmF [Rickettsiaceae bacterium]|jgi:cytochrome c-type biogenesis protein CcmF|nr:ccmF [Rickettsiaceae bacterium]
MIPLFGYWMLVVALMFSLAQFLPDGVCNHVRIFMSKFKIGNECEEGVANPVRQNVAVVFILTAFSFITLLHSHATSDFSVLNVYNNSSTVKPFLYKITGTWGNHEGSMLLIAVVLTAYNFAFMRFSSLAEELKNDIIKVQSAITSGFLAFILFTSNPFETIAPVPENGLGLNPLLQDIGLAIHPPVLYVGYIGLSLGLSYAIIALWRGQADKAWAASLKKWTLFSWSFLTFGVGLGSWWAYRELGWGGFWMWDPVENASFMPWLAATAFLHALIVMEKRESMKIWCVLLGILTFSLTLVGIFLVRSGVLTSVHSFASDPTRGVFILGFLGLVINGSFILFGLKAHKLKPASDFKPLSKEGSILIGNMLIAVACATVLLGTLYPIILEVFSSHSVSVGAPYFNATFNPIILPVLILAGIAPMLKWQQDSFRQIWQKTWKLVAVTCAIALAVWFIPEKKSVLAVIAISFSGFLIASMLNRLVEKLKASGKVSYTFIAMALAHIGVAVLVIGVTVVSIWGLEEERILQIEEPMKVAGYELKIKEMFISAENNYLMRRGVYSVTNSHGDELAVLKPEIRYYPVEQTNTTESAIYYSLLSNVYVVMGDTDGKGGFVTRIYYKPMINLVWLGCLLMALGGIFGLLKQKGIER